MKYRSSTPWVVMRNALLLTALALVPSGGAAYTLQHAKSGDVVRWEESCFYYSLYQDGAPGLDFEAVRETIRASFDEWENIPCSYFHIEETAPASCSRVGFFQDKGNTNLLVWRTSNWQVDEFHVNNAMALTTLSYDDNTGQILDADIEFNAESFAFSLNGDSAKADIRNTATHEIGHMLGLDHSDVTGSTMSYSALPGDTDKQTLEDDDRQGVCDLYPLDEDPKFCVKPFCGLDLDCTIQSCPGQEKDKNENGPLCSVASGVGARLTSGTVSFVLALLGWRI